MKKFACFIIICALLGLPCQADPAPDKQTSFQLNVELRDGSRVIGRVLDDTVRLHSATLGDSNLSWATIRNIEYVNQSDTAELTATNGDVLTVQLTSDALHLETGFGKTELPVKQVRGIEVSIIAKPGRFASGLVAFWSGDGNADDSVGSNNGTLAGHVSYEKGRAGQAFSFKGGKQWVNIGNPTQIQLQDFTVSAWIKRDNTSYVADNNPLAFIFGYDHGGYGIALNSKGQPGIEKDDQDQTWADTAITDTDWHHLAVTKSGTSVVFYVDGVAYPLATPFDHKFHFYKDASIGGKNDYYYDTFAGMIEEVGVYNRALTADEIKAIYTKPPKDETPPAPSAPAPSASSPALKDAIVH